jgi:hypothetical protein
MQYYQRVIPVCKPAFAVVSCALANRIAGTIFPGVTGPTAATVVFLFAVELFAEALPMSDFFVIAIVTLLRL